jgi:type I restriction enzyme S subunit
MAIPLPPLPEQRRIVARIEFLAAKIEEAKGLQKEVRDGLEHLCRSMIFNESFASSMMIPMRELVRLREPDVVVRSEEAYPFAGVYCFGRGVFKGRQKRGMEFAYPRLTRLKTGNFVYPKLMAWEGALGVVPPDCDGLMVSTEFPVFEVDESRVFPEVLDVYFRTPSIWPALAGASTGTNVRRRQLNPSDFLDYRMPLPSRPVQKKLRQVKTRVDAVNKQQSETAAELAALLPSVLDKAFKGEL